MRLSVVVGVTIVLSIIATAGGKPRKVPRNLLKCGSSKKLYPGEAYTVQSPNYPAKYPRKANCLHKFKVDEKCQEPQIVCDKFDVRGKTSKCWGDKLMVVTYKPRTRKKFCGKMPGLSYSATGSSRMNIRFRSNWRDEGSGYSCKVSCGRTMTTQEITTPEGPTPTKDITTPEGPTSSPRKCRCGVPNRVNRIVGGVDTEVNEYPWQVGLVFFGGSKPFCGGSLISSKTVLTAAHCTDGRVPSEISVLVGEHDIDDDNDGQKKFGVAKILKHPDYNPDTTDNDYSLLILDKLVKWSTTASPVAGPICLPHKSSSSYENKNAIVSGWGTLSFGGHLSNILQEVSVSTMTNTACTTNTQYFPSWITDNMICAADGGKDACQGDSGGPLIAKETHDSYSQIGVVSWGIKCAEHNAPGVYSRVTSKLQWIEENMEGSTCPTSEEITTPEEPTPTKEITTPEGPSPTKEITTPEKPTPTKEITTPEEPTPTKEITTPKGSTASPENCNCGVPNRVNRIVGGVDTEINEYPWQVGLIFSGRSRPSCGGSLISSNTILTAAHCTYGRNAGGISVLVGEHDLTNPNDGQEKFEVAEIIQHPAYNQATTDNDYSLLILVNPVEWSTGANPVAGPVCLPEGSSSSYENIEAIVSGWGTLSFGGQLSDILQEVSVKTMTNTECTTNTQYYLSWVTENMICAAASGKDACQGDSGGPLIAKESESGDSYTQIGVVSWGIKCAENNAPGVYSRVTNKLQWIKDNMKGTTCPPA